MGIMIDYQDPQVILAIGLLAVATAYFLLSSSGSGKKAPTGPVTLQGVSKNVDLELIEKEELSHDTRRFRFALPTPDSVLGLPVGQHMSLKYTDDNGKLVSRSYTPVTCDDQKGYVDFVIKVYFKDTHPKFPEGGKMSQHLNDMKIGETITVAGPKGKLEYLGRGKFSIKHRMRDPAEMKSAKKIAMIAGGTGITPMLQVIRYALKDPKDKTEFSILFANQSEDDILCRQELEEMASNHENVKVWYTLDRPGEGWKYSTGFINAEMMRANLPAPSKDTQIFVCGPPPMINFAVKPAAEELGFTDDAVFCF